MFSKFPTFRLAVLLLLFLLVVSVAFPTPVIADGGGGQPFPPTDSQPQGSSGETSFFVTLLTLMDLIL